MGEEKIVSIIENIRAEYEKKSSSISDFEWFKNNIKNNIVETYYDELQGKDRENKINEIMASMLTGIIAFKENSLIKSNLTAMDKKNENAAAFFEDAETAINECSSR